MKKTGILTVFLLLVGCGDNDAQKEAIKMFVKECNVPIAGKLTIDQWGNSVELSCAQFKPINKDK